MLIDLAKNSTGAVRPFWSLTECCFFFFPSGCKREDLGTLPPFFFCRAPNMFHIVSLNGVDSGNAVTLLCLPSFQSEVWPTMLVVVWTGADWVAGAAEAVRLSHVGFLPPLLRSRDVHVAGSVLFCFSASTGLMKVHRLTHSHAVNLLQLSRSCIILLASYAETLSLAKVWRGSKTISFCYI